MKIGISNIVGKSELSQEIEGMVNCEIKRLNTFETKSTLDTSEISKCTRRLLYKSMKPSNDDDAIDLFHNKFVINKWAKLLNYYVVGTNLVLSDCNYGIVGNGDIMLNIEGSSVLLKIQSVFSKDFERVLSKGAFKRHVLELMANEWLAEVDKGLLIYENRDDLRFEILQVHLFTHATHAIESIKRKCKDLMDCKMRGELIKRPYKEKGKECDICNYGTECWLEQV